MMRKKRSPGLRPTILARNVRTESVGAHVGVRVDKTRGLPATLEERPWLEMRGKTDEPIRDVCDVVISVHFDNREEPGATNPPSVGAIIGLRHLIQAVVGLNGANFDRLWTMAMTGHVRYAWIAFTEPHRRSALVVNVSFSNEFEE